MQNIYYYIWKHVLHEEATSNTIPSNSFIREGKKLQGIFQQTDIRIDITLALNYGYRRLINQRTNNYTMRFLI